VFVSVRCGLRRESSKSRTCVCRSYRSTCCSWTRVKNVLQAEPEHLFSLVHLGALECASLAGPGKGLACFRQVPAATCVAYFGAFCASSVERVRTRKVLVTIGRLFIQLVDSHATHFRARPERLWALDVNLSLQSCMRCPQRTSSPQQLCFYPRVPYGRSCDISVDVMAKHDQSNTRTSPTPVRTYQTINASDLLSLSDVGVDSTTRSTARYTRRRCGSNSRYSPFACSSNMTSVEGRPLACKCHGGI